MRRLTSRAPSPTPSRPVHTLDSYLEYGQQLKDLGADSICHQGHGRPAYAVSRRAYREGVQRRNRPAPSCALPLRWRHGAGQHHQSGRGRRGNRRHRSCPARIRQLASRCRDDRLPHCSESRYDTGLDVDLLFEISEYWEEVRKRGHYKRGVSSLTHMQVYSHQVPGGMMSNLVSQLEPFRTPSDRLAEVMKEIPKVRAEVGYPPLVTPAVADRRHAGRVQRSHRSSRWGVVSTRDEGLSSAATTARLLDASIPTS